MTTPDGYELFLIDLPGSGYGSFTFSGDPADVLALAYEAGPGDPSPFVPTDIPAIDDITQGVYWRGLFPELHIATEPEPE